jgi:hypothetical protein
MVGSNIAYFYTTNHQSMKKLLFTFCTLLFMFSLYAQDQLTAAHKKEINAFIAEVKAGNKAAIAKRLHFPFKREYPIPVIKNKEEFIKRYDEIFDVKLVGLISKTDADHDWYAGGWRGIMFLDGDLWLNYDGSLKAVNHQSAAEEKIKQKMIAADRKSVHPSLIKYSRPVHILKTAKYLIRIDDLDHANYRYAAWKASAKMTDTPDIVITNGKFVADGTGGNHSYVFKKGEYTYTIEILIIGAIDSPPANLVVSKGDKEILLQPAQIILK